MEGGVVPPHERNQSRITDVVVERERVSLGTVLLRHINLLQDKGASGWGRRIGSS